MRRSRAPASASSGRSQGWRRPSAQPPRARAGAHRRLRLPLRRGCRSALRRANRTRAQLWPRADCRRRDGRGARPREPPRRARRLGGRSRLPRGRDPCAGHDRERRRQGTDARRRECGTASMPRCTHTPSSSTRCRSSRAGCGGRRRPCPVAATWPRGRPAAVRGGDAALEEARAHVPDNVMLERLELDGDVEEATGLFDEGDLSPVRRRGARGGGWADGGALRVT